MSEPERRNEDLLVFLGVYAAFCFFLLGRTLLASPKLPDRIDVIASESFAVGYLTLIFLGLRKHTRWAWWLAFVPFGLFTLTLAVLLGWLLFEVATCGIGGHHGVAAPGIVAFLFLLPFLLAVFGGPFYLLLASRRALLRPRPASDFRSAGKE